MSTSLNQFNTLPRYRAEAELLKCCRSQAWARTLAGRRPFASIDRLLRASSEVWSGLAPEDQATAQQQDKTTRWCLERLFFAEVSRP